MVVRDGLIRSAINCFVTGGKRIFKCFSTDFYSAIKKGSLPLNAKAFVQLKTVSFTEKISVGKITCFLILWCIITCFDYAFSAPSIFLLNKLLQEGDDPFKSVKLLREKGGILNDVIGL